MTERLRSPNEERLLKCKIPNNAVEGADVLHIPDKDPEIAFKKCFEYAHEKINNDGILIIIDPWYVESMVRSMSFSQLNCNCLKILWSITLKYICENEGRKSPLFHFGHYSSGKKTIKAHMKNPQERHDIIVQDDLARGYEHGFVANISNGMGNIKHISRSNGYAVQMDFDIDFEPANLLVIDAILSDEGHYCDKIMEEGPEIILNLGMYIVHNEHIL